MSLWSKIKGTIETAFQIGLGGPLVKNSSGTIEARNSADTAYAIVRAAEPAGTNDVVIVRSLVSFIDDGPAEGFATNSYKTTTPSGNPFPTAEVWYVDSSMAQKIVELDITRDSQQRPTSEVWKLYAADGVTVLKTITDTVSYSGPFEGTRTRGIV